LPLELELQLFTILGAFMLDAYACIGRNGKALVRYQATEEKQRPGPIP
jgi:hypothetical protein